MTDHERIWLEAAPGADPDYGQQWCQHNVWGDDAIEYVHVEIVAAKDAEIERLRSALQNIIREDDTGPMTFEIRANGPAQAIGGSEGKFASIARAALNGGSDAP